MSDNTEATANQWEATYLRCTIFPTAPYGDNSEDLWINNPDFTLDDITKKPNSIETVLNGSLQDKKVIISVLPIKIDFIIKANDITLESTSEFKLATIGDFNENLAVFKTYIHEWIEQIQITDINRIAFGTELIRDVESNIEGYKELSELLPFKIDRNDTSDFRLQINKPVEHTIEGIGNTKINRLSTWDVLQSHIQIASPGTPGSFDLPPIAYTHLTLDINTVINQGPFNVESTLKIFDELFTIGSNMSERGISNG